MKPSALPILQVVMNYGTIICLRERLPRKDITPIFEDKAQPVCLFEGFMDFLSFLSMKEEVTNQCLVMNSVSNVVRSIHYLNKRNITSVSCFFLIMTMQVEKLCRNL